MKNKLLSVMLLLALAFSALTPVPAAHALTGACSWNGSVDANWSTPGNWDAGCSGAGGIPGAGDTLTFPLGAANATMNNDLPAITLQALNFTGALNYTLNGANAITLTSGIDVTGGNQIINAPLTVGGAGVSFHAASGSLLIVGGTLNLSAFNLFATVDTAAGVIGMQFNSTISGSGAAKISKNGAGELQFRGDNCLNTFDIDLNAGSISTNPAAWTSLSCYGTNTLTAGTDLYLKSSASIGALAGSGALHASTFFQIRQSHNTTFTGDIFGSNQMAVIGSGVSVLAIDRSGGSLSYAGEINLNVGPGKLKLANTTATSVPDFLLDMGELELNNSHVGVVKLGYNGGGATRTGSLILSGTTANTATSLTLVNNSSVTSVINSAMDYGRLQVTTPVDLGTSAPTFALQGSYVPQKDETFDIIQNVNSGTATKSNAAFSNLAQGAAMPFNTNSMEANYSANGNTTFALTALNDVTPPTIASITRADADPTNAASVDFTVTFSEAVTGVTISDFTLVTTGSVSGATVSGISGSGGVYTVTVNTGTGDGTLGLDVNAPGAIVDLAGNPLNGTPFTSGEIYYVVKTAPVLIEPADTATLPTNRPSFDWADFPGAMQYQIQVAANSGFKPVAFNKTVKAASFYLPTKDLLPNTLYYWHVRAKVGKTYTDWSDTWTFTTGNPPSVPKLVAPGNKKTVAGPSPLFDWQDSVAPAGGTLAGYEIQIAADAAFTSIFATGTPTDSQYNGFTLPAGTYYWRVRSVAGNGDYSAWSQVRIVTIL